MSSSLNEVRGLTKQKSMPHGLKTPRKHLMLFMKTQTSAFILSANKCDNYYATEKENASLLIFSKFSTNEYNMAELVI